jgi:hypothetical protein
VAFSALPMVSFFHAAKKQLLAARQKKTTIGRAERATAKVVFLVVFVFLF